MALKRELLGRAATRLGRGGRSVASGGGKLGKTARWAGRAGVFAANPVAGTMLGVGEASIRAGAGIRGGIQNLAKGDLSDKAFDALRTSSNPLDRARSFAGRRPGVTAAMGAAALGPAMYSGGPYSGRRASNRNQNNYYVQRMRTGQSSGALGVAANSLGGLA